MEHHSIELTAYLDGELNAIEAAEFDRTLLPEQRTCLQSDLEIQHALGQFFARPVVCPPTLWKTAIRKTKPRQSPLSFSMHHWRALSGLVVLLLLSLACGQLAPSDAHFLTPPEKTPSAAMTLAEVRQFLAARQVPVSLDPANTLETNEPLPYHLIGAQERAFHGECVVEIIFLCNGEPAKIIIAPKAGAAADEIGKALAQGTVQSSGTLDKVVVAVIGDCPPKDLIRIVDEENTGAPSDLCDDQPAEPAPAGFNAGSTWLV